MKDTLAYFCGGPMDGTCTTVQEVISTFRFPITDYKWSTDSKVSSRAPDTQARVWHFIEEHNCSWQDWENKVGTEGPMLVEQMWAELDAGYHKLNNDNTMSSDKVENLKGYLRGIAWTTALFMPPHFHTADEIVMEVHRRHVHHTAGNTEYETPGLGVRRSEMPSGSKYTETKTTPESAIKHSLSEEQIKKIKGAISAGFSAKDLAPMYGVSVSVIESL